MIRALAATVALGVLTPSVAVATHHLRAGASTRAAPTTTTAPAIIAPAGLTTEVLDVAVEGGKREVRVYRPAGADRVEIPVVYFLHGVPGSDLEPEQAGVLDDLETAFANGTQPFVLVVPDGNGTRADTEWADSLDGVDHVETDIVDDVIPAVEGTNVRDREHRAVVGFSMGGYGAANLASRHPDRFGQMVSIEGYFNTDDPSGMFGADPAAIAANSPDQQAAALAETRVMVLDGTEDDEPACIGEAARYDKILDAAGVDHETGFGPGAHSWDFVRAQAPTWTGFLDAGWPEHAPPGTATPA